jgi:hypothetical protein
MDTESKTSTPDIVILTTAVDRPELHTRVFNEFIKYIGDVNVQWVITINNICNRVHETEQNLHSLLNTYKIHIKTYDTGGSRLDWFNSVKYCINYAYELSPNIGYLWLEDDWSVRHGSLRDDIALMQHSNCHISLANRIHVSFNPSLWGHDAFNMLMYRSINNPYESMGSYNIDGNNTNPERICCPHPESTDYVDYIYTINRFSDVGRGWQERNINSRTYLLNNTNNLKLKDYDNEI